MIKRYMPSGGNAPWNPWKNDSPVSTGRTSGKVGKKKKKSTHQRKKIGEKVDVMECEVGMGSSPEEVMRGEQQPTIPENSVKYEDTCWLHTVGKGDTLMIVALLYKTTEGHLQDINQLRKGDDLDTLPCGSLIAVPQGSAREIIEECLNLSSKADFLEMYGSRLPATFRKKRPPPITTTATTTTTSTPASFFDELDQNNAVHDGFAPSYSPSSSPSSAPHRRSASGGGTPGGSGVRTPASVTKIAHSLKSMFSSQTKYTRVRRDDANRKDQ